MTGPNGQPPDGERDRSPGTDLAPLPELQPTTLPAPQSDRGALVRARVNYTKEAFLNRYNLAVIAGALGISLVTLSPLPLILAAGGELVFLGTIPGMRRFQRLIDARIHAERRLQGRRADAAYYRSLSPNQQATVDSLRQIRDRVDENYRRLSGGRLVTEQSLGKIDQLLGSFVRLLDQLNAYRRYLSATDRGRIEREHADLEKDVAGEKNQRLADIKKRRLDILARRLERFERAEENREIISHQLAAIEDLLRLVHEQSLTLRDPQDISRQLDTLEVEVAETEGTVREMESFLQLQDEALETLSQPSPGP